MSLTKEKGLSIDQTLVKFLYGMNCYMQNEKPNEKGVPSPSIPKMMIDDALIALEAAHSWADRTGRVVVIMEDLSVVFQDELPADQIKLVLETIHGA